MKFRKLLAMVLAVAMIASLAPVLRTTAKAEYVEDNGTIYGSTTAAEKYKDIKISIEEVSSGPYKVGSLIKYLVTFKNAGTSDISFKSIKIHNYNTEDDALKKGFPGITMPKTNNVQYSIVESDKSNTSVGVFQSGNIQNLNYKTGEDHKMISESEYTSYTSPSQRKNNLEALIDNDKPSSGDKPLVIMPADSYFQFYMEFKVEETDKGKTLHNFLGFHLGDSNADNAVGAYIQSSADHVSNSETGKLVLKNTIDGGSETSSQFTVTIKDKDYNGTPSGDASVTLTDTSDNKGKTATFSLASGQTVTFPDVTDATQFTVEQSALSGYTTLSAVKQDTEPSAGEATEGSTTKGEVLGGSSTSTTYVSFFNTISGGTPLPPSPTGATYHLNIPSGLGDKSGDYTYVDTELDHVLELWEIDQFTETSSSDEIKGVSFTDIKADRDNYNSYPNGYLGEYYFVGWSTETGTYNESGNYNYSNIAYPVTYMAGQKKETGSDKEGNGVRGIYGYPSTFNYKTYATDRGTNLYKPTAGAEYFAIWAPKTPSSAQDDSRSGLFGYTMQIAGATFPGVRGSVFPDWNTKSDKSGQKLGFNGPSKNKDWEKYTVLDAGHYFGEDSSKALTVDAPEMQVTNSDGTWNFVGWFNKTANRVTYKEEPKNSGTWIVDKKDPNKDYLVVPGGVGGAANTVQYGGDHAVYSLDAIWSRVTAPVDQTVLYNKDGNKPSFAGLDVKLAGSGYSDSEAGDKSEDSSPQTGWNSIFGSGSNSSKTVTSANLNYYVTIKDSKGSTVDGYNNVKMSLSDVSLTTPGKYTITVNPKLEEVDTSNGKGGKTGVTIDFGTITFNYTIIPQLTVEVTKTIKGDDAWNLDHGDFKFTVTSTGDTTVAPGTITINKSTPDHKDTALITFGKGDTIASPGTYTITITETGGSAAGMTYNTTAKTITVTLGADGTLSGAGIDADPTSEGNYKTAVTIENTYNTGSLTVTKEVAPSNTSKGAGPFTITVTFTGWTPPTDLATGNDQITSVVGSTVTLSLGKGESVTINNIPVGVTYTVEESDSQGATVSYSVTGGSGTIAAGNNNVTVTNTYNFGDLKITKKVEGTNAPASDTFTFTIEEDAGKIADDTKFTVEGATESEITFRGNKATVTITVSGGSKSATIKNLPFGEYTVTEQDKDHYTQSPTSHNVTLDQDGEEITFTNTYDQPTGSLTITKTVEGVASASSQEFTFTITALSGKTVEGVEYEVTGATQDKISFSGTTAEVTVKMDTALTKTVTIAGLPIGYYKVEEKPTSPDNYNTSYAPTAAPSTGVNVTESGGEVTVTNTHKTGNLTISKEVKGDGPAVPTNGTFTFTIQATGTTAAKVAGKTYGDVTFDKDGKSGNVTFTVTGTSGTKIITGLPIGTYTVTEAKVDGYKADAETKSVTLDQDGEEITFTNTYQTGTLKITKTVDGIASASGKEFTFTITAPAGKIADGTSFTVENAKESQINFNSDGTATVTIVMGTDLSKTVTIANLPAGTYTVKEAEMADNYTVDGADSKTVTITGDSTEIVAITNKHDTGSLTITKNVEGGTNVKVSQTFTFTVKAPENLIKENASFNVTGGAPAVFDEHGEAEVTVTLSNSNTGSVTIEGLPVGRYTITEKDVPTGYTAPPSSETADVTKGNTATATITNILQTAELKITKNVEFTPLFPEDQKPTSGAYIFTVNFTSLPAGVTSFTVSGVDGGSKTVDATHQTVTVTVNIADLKNTTTGSKTLSGIPTGTKYEVTESFSDADVALHYTTPQRVKTGTVGTDNVEFTNTYHLLEKNTGGLRITKKVDGSTTATEFTFKISCAAMANKDYKYNGSPDVEFDGSGVATVKVPAGGTVFVGNIPVGSAYTVEEIFDAGNAPSSVTIDLENKEANDRVTGTYTVSGRIDSEYNYDTITYTNYYRGNLTISKTVSGVYGREDFTFTVTLPTGTYNYTGSKSGTISSGGTVTLKAGESITIQNLPAGSTYTVTEAGTANYKTESVGATGTIANNTTAEAAFTNNRNTGSLTVTKTLTGKLAVAASEEFTFTVTLTGVGAELNDTLDGVTFTNGVGTFTITGAGSKTISGLPVGAGFTVKEQDASGYVTTYNNDPANHDKAEGTISANPTTVTVNNDKPDTGTITITKVVENAPAADANKKFEFTITLYLDENLTNIATDVNGEHNGFNFTNGVASFKLKNGDSIVGEGEVTVGEGRLFYKIEETADPDYTTTSENTDTNGKANGRVVTGEFTQDSQNTTVTFTNTYNYGSLTITKKVTDDSGASHANDKFTFTITKKGDSTFNQKVEITGANSQPVSLPAGEYIVTETAGMGDSVAYQVGTSGSSAANAEVTITAGGTVAVTVTNTYYSGGGTGGTGGGGTPSPDIDTSEHYGYIIGVTHTEVAPEQNITRAEIATILFRLLTDEARAANWSENSGFPDVKSGVWYNHAVAVLHKMGIILGDDNGNFNPDQNITRAEVAAMVVRFYEVAEGTVLNNRFTDVETTKWYAEAVLLADYYGLMQGDGDAFKPEDLLTRAEAMTVFNRLLGRKPHKDHLHKDMITWTDNTDKNKWYYAEVQEATNSHTCGNNVVIDGKIYETWSAITKMRDWAALEY